MKDCVYTSCDLMECIGIRVEVIIKAWCIYEMDFVLNSRIILYPKDVFLNLFGLCYEISS